VEARFQDEERLANLLKENRELEASAERYLFLLRFNPDYVRLHNEYGKVLIEERHLDEATSEFRQAVDLNPDVPRARYFLAQRGPRMAILTGRENSIRKSSRKILTISRGVNRLATPTCN
jgi:tetratricopeptide (TPR) repeat protein